MARISASSYNSQSKCELAYHIGRSEEGKKHIEKQGLKWAFTYGTILHSLVQTYDTDRFANKLEIPKTQEEIAKRYFDIWVGHFQNEKVIKKDKLSPDLCKLMIEEVIPTLERWRTNENVKEAAQLEYFIKNTLQPKLPWKFSVKKPLAGAYLEGYRMFQIYVLDNQIDKIIKNYGQPISFTTEKSYNIQYGDHILPGYVDERYVFSCKGEKVVFLVEFKSSVTEYTPDDCQVDNQMGMYTVYEHYENDIPLKNVFVVMYQLPNNVATITQRTEENASFLLSAFEERLRRQEAIESGNAQPMPICGTNSFDHSRLMCDYKDVCPVWKQRMSQPQPIVLRTES